jgi:outer membrane receptor protein involved in Fe transport/opacity protein-like surface antigen
MVRGVIPKYIVISFFFFLYIIAYEAMLFGGDSQPETELSVRTITVQAPRPDWEGLLSPGAVTVVEPDRFQGEQKSLAELLDRVPGLFVHRVTGAGQYTTLRMRGSTAAQVNVYVDGVLQNLGNDAAVDISLIPASQVSRIEIYRGYIPVRFSGSPIGGVVNVVTKKAEKVGVTAEAGIATLGGRNYTLTATTATPWNGSLLFGAHHDESHADFRFKKGEIGGGAFTPKKGEDVFWRKNNKYLNSDFLVKWQNNFFNIKIAYKTTERLLPDPAWYSEFFPAYAPFRPAIENSYFRRQKVKQQDIVTGFRNTIGSIDFGIQLYYFTQNKYMRSYNHPYELGYGYEGYPVWPGSLWDGRDTAKWGGQFDISYKLGDHNLIELYADYSKENLEVRANDFFLPSFSGPIIYNPAFQFWPKFFEERYHLQAQDTISFGSRYSTKLTILYKLDKVKSSGNAFDGDTFRQSWGLALVHEANDNMSFRFSYGTFARYPNFAERFGDGMYVAPTYMSDNRQKAVTWETGEQWDVGVDWHGEFMGAGGRASLTYFNRYTENMMVMYTTRVSSFFANAGHATIDGFEFETYLSWPRLDIDFSATWQRGKMNYAYMYAGFAETDQDHLLTNIPVWQYHIRGNYRLLGNSLSVFAEYHFTDALSKGYEAQHEMPDPQPPAIGTIYDDHVTWLNAGMRWQVNGNFSLIAGVNDLLDKTSAQGKYLELESNHIVPWMGIVDYPGSGRTYYATLRYVFGEHQTLSDAPSDTSSILGNEEGQNDGSFYVASKVVYSRLQTLLSDGIQTIGGGPDGTKYLNRNNREEIWFDPGESFSGPVYGGDNSTSGVGAGLAVGLDFYKIYNIPLRMEIEADMHSRRNIEYGGIEDNYFGTDPRPQDHTLTRYVSKQNLQMRMTTIFLNAFLDFHNSTRFTPYIGGGIGLTKFNFKLTQDLNFTYGRNISNQRGEVNLDDQSSKGQDGQLYRHARTTKAWDLSWNLSVGFSYQLSPSMHLDFSYRYVDFGSQNIDGALPSQFYGERINAGMGFLKALASTTGHNIEVQAHQAIFSLRYDLGAGTNTVTEFDRKREGGLKGFSNFSGPGQLQTHAIKPGAFSISPRIGMFFTDKNFRLKDGYVAGISLGYNIDRNWGVEATVEMTNHLTGTAAGEHYYGKARVGSTHLNAVYHLVGTENELSRWVPYATAGLGIVWSRGSFATKEVTQSGNMKYKSNQPTGDYSSIAVNAGLGVKYFINQNVALRVEALDTFAFRDADFQRDKGPYHNLAVTGGLIFQFGGVQ